MNKKVLAVISGMTLSLAAGTTSLAGECVGTVTAVVGSAVTVSCDDSAGTKADGIKVGDKATIKATGKTAEKAAEKAADKAVEKAAPKVPAAPAVKKKIEGC